VIIAAGSVAFAFSSDTYPLWTVGYVLMGAGGPFVAFSVFSLAALAGSYAPLVIAVFVGVFDASASMMLFMKVHVHAKRAHVQGTRTCAHAGALLPAQVLHSSLGWGLRELFGYYLVFPLSLIPVSFWLFDSHKSLPGADDEPGADAGAGGGSEQPIDEGTQRTPAVWYS
jgi:hypothetical protein